MGENVSFVNVYLEYDSGKQTHSQLQNIYTFLSYFLKPRVQSHEHVKWVTLTDTLSNQAILHNNNMWFYDKKKLIKRDSK